MVQRRPRTLVPRATLDHSHVPARRDQQARTLDGYVREVIALLEDLPDCAGDRLSLDYEFHTGDEAVAASSPKPA